MPRKRRVREQNFASEHFCRSAIFRAKKSTIATGKIFSATSLATHFINPSKKVGKSPLKFCILMVG
jgi:hypothetical protein